MTPAYAMGATLITVLGLVGLRVPIAFALILGAVTGLLFIYGWYPGEAFDPEAALRPMMSVLADVPFQFVHSYELSTIPLYQAAEKSFPHFIRRDSIAWSFVRGR
ncbi:hypothetical protein GCM10011505_33880 [Tistrella bauzanensis]|uniref:Uncharacterized protein n=1 Tax=Tistrella bauzanensis TaxID=657419 RepID=A0ABQ1IT61_9PROT|nr:hypothetical protein [Tistrella bauzanensis]GGB49992.1 hypothetical protein GCM10011505_33880 [Tistrella bauzanensis]